MELHQLRYAELVADEGSFTAAAARARVSQSALSTQVAKLERELGHRLFERGRHGATLTAAGRELLPRAGATLREARSVTETAAALAGVVLGTVRVGAVVGCELPWLATGLATFAHEHPRAEVSYREDGSDRLLDDLQTGRLDLALLGHVGDLPPGIAGTTVIAGPLVAVRPGQWRSTPLTVAGLADDDVVTLPPGTGVRTALDLAAQRAGTVVRPAYEASSGSMVVGLVRRGLGTAVLAAGMVDADDLTSVTISDAPESRLSLAHRHTPSAATAALLTRCLEAWDAGAVDRSEPWQADPSRPEEHA